MPKGFYMNEELHKIRHSASHILATAVLRLFPSAKLDIGPATDTGFYYDFDLDHKFTAEDLANIEAEMKKVISENQKFEKIEVSREEAEKMIRVYQDFAENWRGVPVVVGHKSPNERFAGAEDTLTIEALMQDGKALQSGTSHFLGQNFAKAFDVQYVNKEGKLEYVWATSWGVSTRLMGALIMAHSDNNGLVLPPKLAPIQVVMVPIYKGEEQLQVMAERMNAIADELKAKGVSVKVDLRDNVRSGFKFAEYELKGVPVRLALGPRDMENGTIELARRDTLTKEVVPQEGLTERIVALLDEIQQNIFKKALDYRNSMITRVDTWEEFVEVLNTKGGFISAHWDGTPETEQAIKDATKATIRCIPVDAEPEEGKCIFTGKPSHCRVLFAKSY